MRQPKQVHIFLYRQQNGRYEYAVFQRADMLVCWQGVCGGLEDDETLEQGARRELMEEAGITQQLPLYPLEAMCYLPAGIFDEKRAHLWSEETVLVPMYFYAMPYDGEIRLSEEHADVKWLPYKEAHDRIYFDTQKTSLYELNERLTHGFIKKEAP